MDTQAANLTAVVLRDPHLAADGKRERLHREGGAPPSANDEEVNLGVARLQQFQSSSLDLWLSTHGARSRHPHADGDERLRTWAYGT